MAVEADDSADEGNGVGNFSSGDDAVLRIGLATFAGAASGVRDWCFTSPGDGVVGHFAF